MPDVNVASWWNDSECVNGVQGNAETYLTIERAFRASYRGNRAPFVWGNHFETWNHWAYDRALTRFLLETCRLPDVRCVNYRELVEWLDSRKARTSAGVWR